MTYYEVEWCSEIPIDPETGERDIDEAKYHVKDFRDRGKAIAYAKKMLMDDAFGSVLVTPFTAVPYERGRQATYREYGDSEYVEADHVS